MENETKAMRPSSRSVRCQGKLIASQSEKRIRLLKMTDSSVRGRYAYRDFIVTFPMVIHHGGATSRTGIVYTQKWRVTLSVGPASSRRLARVGAGHGNRCELRVYCVCHRVIGTE